MRTQTDSLRYIDLQSGCVKLEQRVLSYGFPQKPPAATEPTAQ